jgi:hypothetical protein
MVRFEGREDVRLSGKDVSAARQDGAEGQGVQSPTQFQKRSFIRRTDSGSQLLYRKRTLALTLFVVLDENLLLKIK